MTVDAVPLRLPYADASELYALGAWAYEWEEEEGMVEGWALGRDLAGKDTSDEDEMAEMVRGSSAAPIYDLERLGSKC